MTPIRVCSSRPSSWISRVRSARASVVQPWATVRSRAIRVVGVASTTSRDGGVRQQRRVGLQRGGQEGLGGDEHHHELGGAGQRPPVGLAGECVDMGAHLAHVPAQVGCRLVGVVRRERVQVCVERDLGVDDHRPSAGEPDHQVGSLVAVARRRGAPARRSRSARPCRRARPRAAGAARPTARARAACATPWTGRRSRDGAGRCCAACRRPAGAAVPATTRAAARRPSTARAAGRDRRAARPGPRRAATAPAARRGHPTSGSTPAPRSRRRAVRSAASSGEARCPCR